MMADAPAPDAPMRSRLPRKEDGEVLGIVEGMLGASHLQVKCADGKERVVRIPGKIRRNIWVRNGDVVIVKPWSIDSDRKADLAWRYTHMQADSLRRRGLLSY